MLTHARRASLGLCLLILAACAASSPSPDTDDASSIRRDEANAQYPPPPPPPPAPPPPPMTAQESYALSGARGRVAGVMSAPYAQTAPQPMPGDIDRENYEDVDTNPSHLV